MLIKADLALYIEVEDIAQADRACSTLRSLDRVLTSQVKFPEGDVVDVEVEDAEHVTARKPMSADSLSDVGTEQWLLLLELTTNYMVASESLIEGLQGKLGISRPRVTRKWCGSSAAWTNIRRRARPWSLTPARWKR